MFTFRLDTKNRRKAEGQVSPFALIQDLAKASMLSGRRKTTNVFYINKLDVEFRYPI